MSDSPLAHRLRPKTLDNFIGQSHLVGPNGPIRKLIESQKPANIIFWGPPGIGKTTLAMVINSAWKTDWVPLNATMANIQDLRKVIETAKQNTLFQKKIVLFIDEIHRFSKTQQDALLSVVEDGTLTLMGATTENPRFSVIPGLISRALIFELRPLQADDLENVLDQAVKITGQLLNPDIRQRLISFAAGDARKLCNAVDLIWKCLSQKTEITLNDLDAILPEAARSLDDTTHYDLSSALIKSIRGSDVNAALYWLARLLESGEDPVFIARRLVILASEDIGNADPQALILSVSGMQATQLIGMPEARITLSQLVIYLAAAPKNNASYAAIEAALKKVRDGDVQPVPPYLRTRQSQAMSGEKSDTRYLYPHDYSGGTVKQSYWDESAVFYQSST